MNLYLSEQEDAFVRRASERLGTTQSYVIRLLLRDFLDLPIGGSGHSEIAWLTEMAHEHVQNLTPSPAR